MFTPTGSATSRRRLLTGAGTAAVFGSLPVLASTPAATPGSTPDPDLQGAGFYRFTLGDFTLASVSDGTFRATPPQPFLAPDAPPVEFADTLRRNFLPAGHADLQVDALFVDTGRHKVLIDNGGGASMGEGLGHLVRNLARAGIRPADIDAVLISHAHGNHVSGTLDGQGRRVFANAAYVIGEAEWAFWTGADIRLGDRLPDQAARIRGIRRQLAGMEERVRFVRPGQEAVPGIMALAASGHTPGQLAFLICSGADSLFYTADVVHHHVLGLGHPGWHVGFDDDPVLAVATRRKALDRAAIERHLVHVPHFPFPGLGHVLRRGPAYAWQPVDWRW
jgi:glyoxylase-like metal-dependent hydrolase (beta-lactamase superfamily II)